jgi:hypothetical protein
VLSARTQTLVVGRESASTRRRLALAVALWLCSTAVVSGLVTTDAEFPAGVSGDMGFAVACSALLILAGVNAFLDGGLLTSWALSFGPPFAWFLVVLSVLPATASSCPLIPVVTALALGVAFATVIGTAGFVVGLAGRRVTGRGV